MDVLDTCLSPFALRTSQPAIEPLIVAVEQTDRETDMDLAGLIEIGYDLEKVAVKYRDLLDTSKMAQIDTGVLLHQIPGGMYSNLVNQLKELDALDRIHEVMDDLPQTRQELGFPPLVTPTSQIVGIQAVMNVLFGRYNKVTAETQGLAYGLYGKTPAPMDQEVQKHILKGYERGETPTTGRPGDILEPEWDKAVADTKAIAKNEGDILIYALYPTTGMRFLKWKYKLEPVPAEVKAKTLEQVALEDEVYLTIKQKKLFAKVKEYLDTLDPGGAGKGPGDPGLQRLRGRAVLQRGGGVHLRGPGDHRCGAGAGAAAGVSPAAPAAAPAPKPAAAPAAAESLAAGDVPLKAPMPGMIISYAVKVGDAVKTGDLICVLEAMKMQNSLPAPATGVVKAINFEPGASVAKDATILVIGK